MKNFFRILLLCTAVALGACTRDVPGIDEEGDLSSPISFTTGFGTRGAMVSAVSDMTTMGVFCSYTGTTDWTTSAKLGKMFNQKMNYSSGKWQYPTGQEQYWGQTTMSDRYTFFGYAPYGTGVYNASSNASGNGIVVNGSTATAGVPTLTYTVPTKVENQPDLMVAVPRKNIRPTGVPVTLEMNHALTCVAFQIAGDGDKVKSIAVKGVSVTGTLSLDGENIVWSSLGAATTTDFSASLNLDAGKNYYTTTPSMSTNLIKGDGYLMMIPQTLTASAKVVVTYVDNTTKELAFGSDKWVAGDKLTYNITLPQGAPDGSVIAPPGVIGYIKGTNILTLKGSTEYTIVPGIKKYAEDNFGGLSDKTVYVAYFKAGSLVAISSDATDTATPYFEPNDVVAAPSIADGYIGLDSLKRKVAAQTTDALRWTQIPSFVAADWTAGHRNISDPTYQSPSTGKGDPCAYYSDLFGTGWMTPVGNPYNGAPAYTTTTMMYRAVDALGKGIPAGYTSEREGEAGMFYPATTAQRRNTDGLIQSVTYGYYWASTPYNNANMYGMTPYNNSYTSYSGAYAFGFTVRCVKPAISVSPDSATFAIAGESKTFAVTSNVGVPTVTQTAGTSWWLTPTLSTNGQTLTIKTLANPLTTERTATVTLTADGVSATVSVTQEADPVVTPVGGNLAAPGVIGYIAGTNTLTLKGSKEYKANPDIKKYAEDNFGGLSDQTVYVAYFKFGSLVAISGDPTDTATPFLEPNDIVAAPSKADGYIGLDSLKAKVSVQTTDANRYAQIPSFVAADYTAGIRSLSDPAYQSPSTGKGDPCIYYFGSEYGDGWKLPSGNPYNGTPNYTTANLVWHVADALGDGIPAGRLSTRPGETGMFYSFTGFRNTSNGQIQYQDALADYWGATVGNNTNGPRLYFTNSQFTPSEGSPYAAGQTFRCVKSQLSVTPETVVFTTTHAATKTVTVSSNLSEAPTITQSSGSTLWLTPTLSANGATLTLKVTNLTDTQSRTATVTLTAGGVSATVTVVQEMGGVLAAPGQIGYIKGSRTLTLKGSRQYSVNPDIKKYADDNFGGLSDTTVYAAMFTAGGLLAFSSDPSDTAAPTLSLNDFITGPSDFIGLSSWMTNISSTDWPNVPHFMADDWNSGLRTISDPTYQNSKEGKGDPCMYYFGSEYGGGWMTPKGNPYNGNVAYTTANLVSKAAGALGDGLPAGVISTREGEEGMFFPVTGLRRNTDALYQNPTYGYYWAATPVNTTNMYGLVTNNFSTYNATDTYGFSVRCVQPSLSVSTDNVAFTSLAATKTVTVTSNVGVTVTQTTGSDSWLTVTLDATGKTLTLKATANTLTSERTATVTLTGGGLSATVTVVQGNGAVIAPPGVIGYIAGTNTLTLKGSREYKNATAVDSNGDGIGDIEQYAIDNFGGLSDQTVFIAYFKFGSLIALSCDPTDTVTPFLEADDIIAAPSTTDGYIGLDALKANVTAQTTDAARWNLIPKNLTIPAGATSIPSDPANSFGDPCTYYFGSGWRTPKGSPYNGTPNYTTTNLVYYDWGALGTGLPSGRLSTRDGETGMFYPFGGQRNYTTGQMLVQFTGGYYLPSTYAGGIYYCFAIGSSSISTGSRSDMNWGFNVRCVPAE